MKNILYASMCLLAVILIGAGCGQKVTNTNNSNTAAVNSSPMNSNTSGSFSTGKNANERTDSNTPVQQ